MSGRKRRNWTAEAKLGWVRRCRGKAVERVVREARAAGEDPVPDARLIGEWRRALSAAMEAEAAREASEGAAARSEEEVALERLSEAGAIALAVEKRRARGARRAVGG